jgi:hypothetical protein
MRVTRFTGWFIGLGLLLTATAGGAQPGGRSGVQTQPAGQTKPAAAGKDSKDAQKPEAKPPTPVKTDEGAAEPKDVVTQVPREKAGAEVFDEGVRLFYGKNYAKACRRLWDYIGTNEPGAENYGYAEYFLAMSLKELGFTHAAVEYIFNVAKNRTKAELLPDALMEIERMTREHPFDQELVLKDLLYDTSFGYLREDLRDFAEYYQGYLDYQNGFIDWAEKHFANIRKDTYYEYKSRYIRAIYGLVKFDLDAANKMLEEILASNIKQSDVINNARQSLARILFEQKKYDESYRMFETIDAPIEKQAAVFLEEAWTQYYLKNYQRSMGLLYALEAPAFYRYFNPEKYVLKALIYTNLCHYNVAKDAVDEFRRYYGDALRAIYDRVELEKNEVLLDAALQDPALVEISKFQKQLDTELGLLEGYEGQWRENGLYAHLVKIYDLKIKEVNRRLKEKLDRAVRAVAESLLEFDEQMNLLEYEIGLSIYKRVKGTPSQHEVAHQRVPFSGAHVYYTFDGEFWNDELHDLKFFIEDRCYSEERWE